MPDIVDGDLATGDDAAHHAECLGERSYLYVELALEPKVADDAFSPTQYAFAMRIVDHCQDVVPGGYLIDLVQRGDIAIHAEHAVGDHHASAVLGEVLADLGVEIGGVTVFIDDDLGAGESRSVDDAGVVEPVGKDHILFSGGSVAPDQRWDRGLVGAEAALYQQRGLD